VARRGCRDALPGRRYGTRRESRKLGLKLKKPGIENYTAIEEQRGAITAVVGASSDGSPIEPAGWTSHYAARRIAWHVLEHAWEMQDRAQS